MPQPLVSVIMAVRNGERFLAEAISSVLAQGWRPLEILVVDGHSTDGTAAIARSFAEVRYVPQTGRGVADAYNTGISAAQGQFVAFLSHDDRWTLDKLKLQMNHLLSHPEHAFAVARVKFFAEPSMPVPAGFRKDLLEGDHVGYIMETLVARKSVFTEIGGFDAQLTSGEDVDWFARARDGGVPHAVIPIVLLHKRVHDANLSLTDAASNQMLLKAMRRSIERKRRSLPGREP